MLRYTYKWCVCTFVALILSALISSLTSAIVVDQSGRGDFRTIQAAIDSVPYNNQNWVTIDIRAGTYREKVWIHSYKPFIYLRGEGMNKTFITWNDHEPINEGATFTSDAENILAKDITFMNLDRSSTILKGVAVRVSGDKSAFYQCAFGGLQDTLWDDHGRHYFRNCAIAGGIDFIFGGGQSHYEGCTLVMRSFLTVTAVSSVGFITGQGRGSFQETDGFVFKSCNIAGNGRAYLGRAWRDYATVLFYDTKMSEGVDPQGWSVTDEQGRAGTPSFSEYNCSGPGSNPASRRWEKKLSDGEVNQLISRSYIDNEGWVDRALHRFTH